MRTCSSSLILRDFLSFERFRSNGKRASASLVKPRVALTAASGLRAAGESAAATYSGARELQFWRRATGRSKLRFLNKLMGKKKELLIMVGSTIKSVIAAAMLVAAASSAMALETYRSYDAGCARWSSQGAGQRIKCFDCLERQKIGGKWLWVNTCAHAPY
jgi:hypothetical protein